MLAAQVRQQLRPVLQLAVPLVAAEIGWMSMGVVDTMMVGRLPDAPVAMSSVALAQILYSTLAYGLGGVLLGLDTVISQAHGAGDLRAAHRWLLHGLLLAVAVAAVLMGIFALAPLAMHRMSADPGVNAGAIRTLHALNFGVVPLLLYFTLRRYLQAFNHVRVIAAALLSANAINLLFNWLLIYGHQWTVHLGAGSLHVGWSALGVAGSGLATSLARTYQALFLGIAVWLLDRRHAYGLRSVSLQVDWQQVRHLLALGVPTGATILVEISIFGIVTFLIARLGAVSLAGHEIALNCVSFTFMIPMGISAAASVRVGQAVGRGDQPAARAAGWAALALAAGSMLACAILYLMVPRLVARAFTPDPAVIAASVAIFAIAPFFQVFDGLQITAIGALRGLGDTHSGLLTHLGCYGCVGIPLGVYLAFRRHLGAPGFWIGLCCAVTIAGSLLVLRWHYVSRRLKAVDGTV